MTLNSAKNFSEGHIHNVLSNKNDCFFIKNYIELSDVLTRHNVKIAGEGQPMMFVHGFGCDQNMWRYIVPAFAKGYKIVLLDLLGAGGSDTSSFTPEKYSSLHGHAEDILEVCEALDLREVIYVGHSVSSMIGALADIQRPGILAKMILIGPSACYINDGDYYGGFDQKDIEGLLEMMESNYLGWSASLAPSIMGNPDHPELGDELTESFCKTDPIIAKHFARATFLSDNRDDLCRVQAECLILQCSDDIIAPEGVGRYVHQKIPMSKFVLMEATGHCPHMSAPDETIKYIQSFLN